LDQVPAASLDADDPLDEENSDDPDSDDDTAQLLAELQRIKKERSMEQAKRVSRGHGLLTVEIVSEPTTFKDD
jgi:protein CWC15